MYADYLFVSSGGTILFYMLFYTALHSKWFGGGLLCVEFYSLHDLKIRGRTLPFKLSTLHLSDTASCPHLSYLLAFNLFTKYDPEGISNS